MAGKPEEIIERIELTRRQIGETADALANRLDIVGRTRSRFTTTDWGAPGTDGAGPRPGFLASPMGRAALTAALAVFVGYRFGRVRGRRERLWKV